MGANKTNTRPGSVPANIVEENEKIWERCEAVEKELPECIDLYMRYLKTLKPRTRLAYLRDIRFFFTYLADKNLYGVNNIKEIDLNVLEKITATDINIYLDDCRRYKTWDEEAGKGRVVTNGSVSLARKKASLLSLFKYLYRHDLKTELVTDKVDPIKTESMKDKVIKVLEEDEVMDLLDAVRSGEGLTEKEKDYWEKTKQRNYAIFMLFLSCALRISELSQLNISTIDFHNENIKIFRKGGKETEMPLNQATLLAIREYIEGERRGVRVEDENVGDALFISLKGNRMSERQIREMVKKYTAIAMRCSLKYGYSPHKLRATAATALIDRGNDIYSVQEFLDHKNVTTTQIYARHKRETARKLTQDLNWDQHEK